MSILFQAEKYTRSVLVLILSIGSLPFMWTAITGWKTELSEFGPEAARIAALGVGLFLWVLVAVCLRKFQTVQEVE